MAIMIQPIGLSGWRRAMSSPTSAKGAITGNRLSAPPTWSVTIDSGTEATSSTRVAELRIRAVFGVIQRYRRTASASPPSEPVAIALPHFPQVSPAGQRSPASLTNRT